MDNFDNNLNEILKQKFDSDLETTHKIIGEVSNSYAPTLRSGRELIWVYTTALSKHFKPKNILEIGTGFGKTTHLLSHLFPDSNIHTIDLPLDDPKFQAVAYRGGSGFDAKQMEFDRNIDRPNITTHIINTFFLPTLDLPKFDLIWLDAGHQFPEMAWDTMYAYNALNEGGHLLFHDYSTDNGITAVRPTIEYITPIIKEEVVILPAVKNIASSKIAWIHKNGK